MKKLRVFLLPVIWIAAFAILMTGIIGYLMVAIADNTSYLLPDKKWIFEGWK